MSKNTHLQISYHIVTHPWRWLITEDSKVSLSAYKMVGNCFSYITKIHYYRSAILPA